MVVMKMTDLFKRALYSSTLLFISFIGFGQAPNGYYNSALGLGGEELRTALSNIIDNHTVIQYTSLWSMFYQTDRLPNGYMIDIYSDQPGGTPAYQYAYGTGQCGNYSAEGDCYNREHSVPQDWFGSASPMYSDLFHIYPTDGFVNGKRSNFPYGEVGSSTWTSTNGSKVGSCNYPGCSGTVFEPINEYKGDLARTYFYMVTRYKNNVSSWNSSMFSGNTLAPWALEMLLAWSDADSVSQREIDRNNAIYALQGNRNPFIDSVNFKNYIWRGVTPPPVGIKENTNNNIVISYSENRLTVSLENNKVTSNGAIQVFSIIGKQVASYPVTQANTSIATNLSKGMYIAVYNEKKVKFVVK